METKVNSNAKRTAIKVSLVAVISLLLLIPLAMIKGVIEDREQTKDSVTMEVANSYAKPQTRRLNQAANRPMWRIMIHIAHRWITRQMLKPMCCIARFMM